MICVPCKRGGDASAKAKGSTTKKRQRLALFAFAKRMHAKCIGCDCQHRVEGKREA
jgi:hypothetical protein